MHPYLEDLNISTNRLMSPKSMKTISDVIIQTIKTNKSCKLKKINISSCDITDKHIACLQPCIPYFRDLNISGNEMMSSTSMRYVSSIISRTTEQNGYCNLERLDISLCSLTDKHIKYLQPCLPHLKYLDIRWGTERLTKKSKLMLHELGRELYEIL